MIIGLIFSEMYRIVLFGFLVIFVCKLVSVCSEDIGFMFSNEFMKWLIYMFLVYGCIWFFWG